MQTLVILLLTYYCGTLFFVLLDISYPPEIRTFNTKRKLNILLVPMAGVVIFIRFCYNAAVEYYLGLGNDSITPVNKEETMKKPSISDYNRIKDKMLHLVRQSIELTEAKNIINSVPNQYWLVSYQTNNNTISETHIGNLADSIIWFTTLHPTCVPIASWPLTEEQYITMSVNKAIITQLNVEGFEPSHFIE